MIDVCTGEYGHEYIDKMISIVDNGRCLSWTPYDAVTENNYRNEKISSHSQFIEELEVEINPKHLRARSTFWEQFWTLYKRRSVQMWRDSVILWRSFSISLNVLLRRTVHESDTNVKFFIFILTDFFRFSSLSFL